MAETQNALSFRGKAVNLFCLRTKFPHDVSKPFNSQTSNARFTDFAIMITSDIGALEATHRSDRHDRLMSFAANIARTGLTDFVRL